MDRRKRHEFGMIQGTTWRAWAQGQTSSEEVKDPFGRVKEIQFQEASRITGSSQVGDLLTARGCSSEE